MCQTLNDLNLMEQIIHISNAPTPKQAYRCFTEACRVLNERAALLLFPFLKVLEAQSYHENGLASLLNQALRNVYESKEDPRSAQILA